MPTFQPGDEVTYPRGTPAATFKGFVSKLGEQVLPNGVTRVDILENGGARYHIDKRNVTLVPPAPPPPPAPAGIIWGVNTNQGPSAADFQAVAATGAKSVRLFGTSVAEVDSQISGVVAAGLQPLIVVRADDQNSAKLVLSKYGPSALYWQGKPASVVPTYFEVHNEPYLDYEWAGGVNPPAYASGYKATVQALRAIDPKAKFILAGAPDIQYQGTWQSWPKRLVTAVPDIGSYADAVSIHPYPGGLDTPGVHDVSGGWQLVPYERQLWLDVGIDKPMWITEAGENVAQSDEANQDAHAKRYIADLKAGKFPYVAAFHWFSLRNFGAADQWGLYRDDGTPRPALATLKTGYGG